LGGQTQAKEAQEVFKGSPEEKIRNHLEERDIFFILLLIFYFFVE